MIGRRRSQARILALQALCLFDALGEGFEERLGEFLHDSHAHADLGFKRAPPAAVLAFARQLATGTWRQRQQYDELLSRIATGWSVARMPPVDRNILRLGLHELREHPETPPEVVINEAIELARLLGGEDSPAFVNGVLDASRRQLETPRAPPAGAARNTEGSHPEEERPAGST